MTALPIADIRQFPTDTSGVLSGHPEFDAGRLHESLFRSYQILQRVKWLLHHGASNEVVMQEIEEMETAVMP